MSLLLEPPASVSSSTAASTAPSASESGTVHAVLRGWAARTPDATALVHGDLRVDYRELDRLSDAYALLLRDAGVRAGAFVPVRLPRSVPLVATMLAVLKLGAAYSLVDASWPDERVRDVAAQLGATVLVTEGPRPDSLPQDVRLWSPDGASASLPHTPPADPPRATGDACCVFFTSGSTGAPKGAVSPHSGIIRLVDPGSFVPFGRDTVMPVAAAQPWDLFSLELWAPLLSGGTAVLTDEPYLSVEAIRSLRPTAGVNAVCVNTVWVTTSLFNMLVDEDVSCFAGLDTVIIGGERVSPRHCAAFLAAHPDTALVNGYGPVESTVFASTHRIRPADCVVPGGVPIGSPVPRTRIYVLDGERQCADGEIGELCFAGDGLALEYLGRPDLTERAFPTLTLDGRTERVYRSGDLGLRDADGLFHYRGRADRQVKVRGHRVEPGEVETVIAALPGVAGCAVVPKKDPDGACTALLAFVTLHAVDVLAGAHAEAESARLLAELRLRVPAYQVPEQLVVVPEIPLTLNGKLDSAALLAQLPAVTAAPAILAEHTPLPGTETTVAQVVSDVVELPVGSWSPEAPFGTLGANSLAFGRIATRLAAALGRPVPLSQVYRAPSVRGLANWLDRTAPKATTTEPSTPALDLDAATTVGVPLSVVQQFFLMEHLQNPDDRAGHCVLSWRIDGRPDRLALRKATAAVHRRHRLLGARYLLDATTSVAVLDDLPVPPTRELVVSTEAEARRLLDRELARPFRLETGRIWQPVLIAVRERPVTYFGVAVHHIAFDGASASVLARELGTAYRAAYRAARSGETSDLAPDLAPDLTPDPVPGPAPDPTRVAEVRDAQRAFVDLEAQRAYWTELLADQPDLDFPSAADTQASPHRIAPLIEEPVPAWTVEAVAALAARCGASPYTVYLAAYAQTVAECTGQQRFVVGTPVSQRGDAELAAAVNCLISPLGLALSVDAALSPTDAVSATAPVVADAFAAQDVPLPEALALLGRTTEGGRLPVSQTMFALQDNAPAVLDLGDDGPHAELVNSTYPGVPSELFTEIWPQADGSARLVVSHRPERVSEEFCARLAEAYLLRLRDYATHG